MTARIDPVDRVVRRQRRHRHEQRVVGRHRQVERGDARGQRGEVHAGSVRTELCSILSGHD